MNRNEKGFDENMVSKTILNVKNLSKKFDDIEILSNVNMKVEEGEFIAVMCQSGCGKSTLLYNISGMDKIDSGEVLFNGKDISKLCDKEMSEVRLKYMGFIFQHSYLLKNLSIRDNIVLPGFKAKVRLRNKVNRNAEILMKRTGIDNIAEHDIKKVSGGQLQRAAICRSLINNPKILFGDEPTGALNSSATKEVMDIINDINEKGTAVVIVTHDAKVALRAERIIFLRDGKIDSQLILGKYNDNDKVQRDKKLSKWLEVQGF